VVGICRVVKGFGSAAILSVAIRPMRNEKFRDRAAKCGGSHVESRVAGIKVASDFAEKVGRWVLACSADFRRDRCKRGSGRQAARHFVDVAIHDMTYEFKKD
jgi:hypothetical protein